VRSKVTRRISGFMVVLEGLFCLFIPVFIYSTKRTWGNVDYIFSFIFIVFGLSVIVSGVWSLRNFIPANLEEFYEDQVANVLNTSIW